MIRLIVLEKGNSNENFKCYLSSLRRKNVNRVFLEQSNSSLIRNKFDLSADGIKGKIDILMTSETKIDDVFLSSQFYIEGFTPLYRLY